MSIPDMNVIMNIKDLVCKDLTELFFRRSLNRSFFCSPLAIGATVEVNIDVDKCENITSLEHVTANVSFTFHRRGDVKITLISPSGTPSEMISYRDNDASEKGLHSSR